MYPNVVSTLITRIFSYVFLRFPWILRKFPYGCGLNMLEFVEISAMIWVVTAARLVRPGWRGIDHPSMSLGPLVRACAPTLWAVYRRNPLNQKSQWSKMNLSLLIHGTTINGFLLYKPSFFGSITKGCCGLYRFIMYSIWNPTRLVMLTWPGGKSTAEPGICFQLPRDFPAMRLIIQW